MPVSIDSDGDVISDLDNHDLQLLRINDLSPKSFYLCESIRLTTLDSQNPSGKISLINRDHCFQFQLRYVYSPIFNTKHQCYATTLIGCCPSDLDLNIFVRVLLDHGDHHDQSSDPLALQEQLCLTRQYVGRFFELQNFRTIKSNEDTMKVHLLRLGFIKSKRYPQLGIMVSFKRFRSILKICPINFGKLPVLVESDDVQQDAEEENSGINLVDSQVVEDVEEDHLTTRSNKRPIESGSNEPSGTGKKQKLIGELQSKGPISGKILLVRGDQLEVTSQNKLTTTIVEVTEDTSTPYSELDWDILHELESNLNQWFQTVNSTLFTEDTYAQVVRFFQSNVSFLETQSNSNPFKLTKLDSLRHPISSSQSNFYNTIAIVKSSVINFEDRRLELVLTDETDAKLSVSLVSFDYAPPVPLPTTNASYLTRSGVRQLLCGQLVLIRDLEMKHNSLDVTAQHYQIKVVEIHQNSSDRIELTNYNRIANVAPTNITNRAISPLASPLTVNRHELSRILQLSYYQVQSLCSRRLLFTPIRTASAADDNYGSTPMDCNVTDLVGQLLTTRVHPSGSHAEVYLLLTSNSLLPPCFVGLKSVIKNIGLQLAELKSPLVKRPTLVQLCRLVLDNFVFRVLVFDSHCKALDSFQPLDYLALYNVHAKPDQFNLGYTFYLQHGGDKFGRRIHRISPQTIFADHLDHLFESLFNSLNGTGHLFVNELLQFYLSEQSVWNIDSGLVALFPPETLRLIERMAVLSKQEHYSSNLSQEQLAEIQKRLLFLTDGTQCRIQTVINLTEVKPIRSFQEMKFVHGGLPMFRIRAKLVDYQFNCDTLGEFRSAYVRFKCSNKDCDFHIPFEPMVPKIAHLILRSSFKDLLLPKLMTCPHCYSSLKVYGAIMLFLEDRFRKRLPVMLVGSELERLMGLDRDGLLFEMPHSETACRTLHFMLESMCDKSKSEPVDQSSSAAMPPQLRNQNFNWILHSIMYPVPCSNNNDKNLGSDHRKLFPELFDPKYQLKPELGRSVDQRENIQEIPDQVFYVRGFTLSKHT